MPVTTDSSLVDVFDSPAVARLRRRSVTLLSTAQILNGLAAGSVVSVGSLIAVKLAGSNAWAGSVTTASTLGAALSSLALARLAASRGRRISLVTGFALASLGATSIIVSAVYSSRLLLLVGGALMGMGSAANLQARFAATDLSTTGRRASTDRSPSPSPPSVPTRWRSRRSAASSSLTPVSRSPFSRPSQ